MIGRAARARSGITLTEILISILILGVGLVSLATLFPIGLLRLREAQRASRSGFLVESAESEMEARSLLNKSTFLNPYFSPWNNATAAMAYDPFIQDTPTYVPGTPADPFGTPGGVYRGYSRRFPALPRPGPGLPIAYDPLWRFVVGSIDFKLAYIGGPAEGRFASGYGFVRPDPSDKQPASAWGLQRLTNFNPALTYNPTSDPNNTDYAPLSGFPALFAANTVPSIFVSPEDIVMQSANNAQNDTGLNYPNGASTVVPTIHQDPNTGAFYFENDWRFSWMFTGQQSDAGNGMGFDGDIVIFENRPFGIDHVNTPFAGLQYVPTGETVVEAVFGNGVAADRTVLLRWPVTMPDPEVKVGNWIADVTYERNQANETARTVAGDYPIQRCYWYQVVKRTDPGPAISFGESMQYRSMTVWVSTPLRAQTLLVGSGAPVHVNAALICPSVIYVYPKTLYMR